MKVYKVWVHVEEIDEENDSYTEEFEGSDLPDSVGGLFSTPKDAYKVVDDIQAMFGEGQ